MRLLIVDDHRVGRESLRQLLTEDGYECSTAEGGTQALGLLRAQPFDLMLLDINMPGMCGLSVLEKVRHDTSAIDLPVIMVTARDGAENVVKALDRGANDYVTKPIDENVLLARIRTQLQFRELARTKDQFLRIASHDLKNPLTATYSAAELLRDMLPVGAKMTSETRGMVDIILRRNRQMRQIITDFLDLGALESGQLALSQKPVDLGQLATEVVGDNLGYAQSKELSLSCAPGEGVPELQADPDRLAQVIENLVGNAIKFSPKGARVEVATYATGSGVGLAVRDTGPGLREEDFPKLFVKYARLSNRPTGGEKSTGLGLVICKLVVERHGGRIGARNAEGGGAVFWFELPR